MKTNYFGQFAPKVLLLIWVIFCILFFMILPGKVTYVQWANLGEWQLLGGKLQRLELVSDFINLLRSFTGVIFFSAACTSIGIYVATKLKINSLLSSSTGLSGLTFLATGFLIGNGLFSLIFLTLSGTYRLTPAYIVIILCSACIVGFSSLKNSIPNILIEVKSNFKERTKLKTSKIIMWLSISSLLGSLLYSTARISYDASAIYFSNAKLTAMAHHVQFFLDDTFVASAFQTGIQYTALIQVFGDQSARMLSWVCGVIVIIFSIAIGERVGLSSLARQILVVLLLTTTAFLDLMGDGKVDLMSFAPAIAAIYWMIVDCQNKMPTKSWLLLIGFLTGMAIVARPFNALLLGVFIILMYLQRVFLKFGFEPLSYRLFIESMLWFIIAIAGFGVYHLFANWMILGNPLAFLSMIPKINPSTGPWDYNPDRIMAIRLLYPFVATFYNSPQTLGNISPLFLAFLPALLIRDIRKQLGLPKQLYVLCSISLVTLLLWIFLFFTVYEIRYVLFLWAIIFMPVAEIIASVLENKDRLLQHISSALIITLLIFGIVRTIYISLDTYSPIDKQGNPQCFCESLGPINKSAASGDRVLTLSAFRYYLRTDLFACSTKHDEYKELQAAAQNGSEAFWLEVYRQGYKFISYEHDYTIRHLQMGIIPSPSNTPEWLELEQIYSSPDGGHAAYRINVKTPPDNMDTTCKINASGIWEVQSTE